MKVPTFYIRSSVKSLKKTRTRIRKARADTRAAVTRRCYGAAPRLTLWLLRVPSRLERLGPKATAVLPASCLVDGDVIGIRPQSWVDLTSRYPYGSRQFPNWPHLGEESGEPAVRHQMMVKELAGTSKATSRIKTNRPIVRPVRNRPGLYHVVDGHHRILRTRESDYSLAEFEVEVDVVRWSSSKSPMDELLQSMSWMSGESALYQPVDAGLVASRDRAIRTCSDRLDLIRSALADVEYASFLDVGACYGYFVSAFTKKGAHAVGIERDPLAPAMGELAYGLERRQFIIGSAEDLIKTVDCFDVVSCFSLVHHIWIQSPETATEFIADLWQKTSSVLFLDSGTDKERWLRGLGAPNEADITGVLESLEGGEVRLLGRDNDGGGKNAGNYGRQLYAVFKR